VKLPKGQFVKLQPHTADWLEIPEKTRKSVLEFALRGYQSVTVGDRINLEYNGSMFRFHILELQPDEAVSLVDADVPVEVTPPLEEARKLHESVELDQPIKGAVGGEEYKYYVFDVQDPNLGLTVSLAVSSGDADIYVSNTVKQPTKGDYTWMNQHTGTKFVTVDQKDPQFTTGNYYIGIHGYKNPAEYSLSVSTTPEDKGHQLKDSEVSAEVETKQCENCFRRVPSQSYQMHFLNCVRRNFRCTKCGVVISADEKNKHLELEHTAMMCECGVKLEQQELYIHKQHECPLRLVKCVYCPLKIPLQERGRHQEQCGGRTVTCSHCVGVFKRNQMKSHMERQHDIHLMDITESQEIEHFL